MQQTQAPLGLQDYIEIFFRRKWVFILTFIPISIIAFIGSYFIPPVYKSTTTILVERQKVPEAYVEATVETDIAEKLSTLQTQIVSRTHLEKIIVNYELYKYEPGAKAKVLAKFGIEQKPPTMGEIVDRMREDIEINVTGKDAFQVSYIGSDPHVTMLVTNDLAFMFIEENLKLREQRAEGTTEFLASELLKAENELEEQEVAIRAFKEKHMGSLPGQIETNLRTLDRLQLESQAISVNLKSTNDRKILIEEQLASLAMDANSSDDKIKLLENELAQLKDNLALLRVTFKDTYPDVIFVQNRIKEVEAILSKNKSSDENKKGGASGGSASQPVQQRLLSELRLINSDIQSLKGREKNIISQIKEFEKRIEQTPANEQMLAILVRDYTIMQQNYQSLLEKRLNARLSENMEKRQKGEQFRILDPANLPEKPFGGLAKKLRLLGLVAGGGLGAGLIALVEFLNPAFRKPEDFTGLTEVPILAAIPHFSMKPLKK